MFVFIAIVLIILSFVFPSKKVITFFDLLFMWILFAFNTGNADYIAYEGIYSRIGSGDLFGTTVQEEGFVYLAYFSNKIFHMNYSQFLILIATLSTILLYVVLKLYLNNINQNIVLALFLVLNYWVMICQYRTYIATLLVIIGIYFLINDNTYKGILYFVFLLF